MCTCDVVRGSMWSRGLFEMVKYIAEGSCYGNGCLLWQRVMLSLCDVIQHTTHCMLCHVYPFTSMYHCANHEYPCFTHDSGHLPWGADLALKTV